MTEMRCPRCGRKLFEWESAREGSVRIAILCPRCQEKIVRILGTEALLTEHEKPVILIFRERSRV